MKAIVILICALLSGCTQQKPDPRLSELEAQRSAMENRIANLEYDNARLFSIVENTATASSNMFVAMKDVMPQLTNMQRALIQVLQLTNSPVEKAQTASRRLLNPMLGTSNGVPTAIYNTIRADASRRYPTDFDTQEYIVRQQIEAYRKLNP